MDPIHDREARFHDEWASATRLEDVQIRAAFESITAQENRFILDLLAPLAHKRILDVGCGLGESALYLAMQGADVTALDISSQMIELCLQNAVRLGVRISGVVSTAERFEVEPSSFDVVHAANLVHHLQDRPGFYANVHRALKPGGTFVAWDPLAYNPAITVYRRLATRVRTVDERPLYFDEFKSSRRYFPDLRHREFWLLTLLLFVKYFAWDRLDPNRVRYWKRILLESRETIGWWFLPLQKLDSLLLRLPFVGRLAWNTVQWGTKPDRQ
ncbi:MAG: class I SAM-dependent methyltransferase [Candidatus Riflebacteria bacterium]|nr:class I SAM-dependent methyltransferase [Candidatus Riflebacteria bacterium]